MTALRTLLALSMATAQPALAQETNSAPTQEVTAQEQNDSDMTCYSTISFLQMADGMPSDQPASKEEEQINAELKSSSDYFRSKLSSRGVDAQAQLPKRLGEIFVEFSDPKTRESTKRIIGFTSMVCMAIASSGSRSELKP